MFASGLASVSTSALAYKLASLSVSVSIFTTAIMLDIKRLSVDFVKCPGKFLHFRRCKPLSLYVEKLFNLYVGRV